MSGDVRARAYEGRGVLVIGLGVSGIAAARYLASQGARVVANDSRPAARLSQQARALSEDGVELFTGAHPGSVLEGIDQVVVSPGVSLNIDVLATARRRGIPIWGELELGARACAGRIVAVTGTKGKSTTSTLIERGLTSSGLRASLTGNIGVPLVQIAAQARATEIVVVEASSFQLATIDTFCPEVALLLDVSPDHLDWHPDFDDYVASKTRIFENQRAGQWSVVYGGNELTLSMAAASRAQIVSFDLVPPQSPRVSRSVHCEGTDVVMRDWETDQHVPIASLRAMTLPGDHNRLNFVAACAALHVLGVSRDPIEQAGADFRGLEHAIEWVDRVRGVDFYNDSKATQMVAVAAAIRSFDAGRIHLILGGRAKGGDFADLREHVREVKGIYAIGESIQLIERALSDVKTVRVAESLPEVVSMAFARAVEGDIVLLSPGGSSFDLFDNYRQRGDRFKEIVTSLAKSHSEND